MSVAASLLVSGFLVFLAGAAFWKPAEYQQPLRESLIAMARDAARLRWIYSWMIAGVLTTTVAVGVLATELSNIGEAPLAIAAAIALGIGAIGWMVALSFHLTVGQWAAGETVRTDSVPVMFDQWNAWMGHLYWLHMVLGYLATALLGAALLSAQLTPRWFALGALSLGTVCLLGFVALRGGPLSPPILVHALTAAIGIGLLVFT